MTISNDLMLAILAMDSYNRGYGAGIDLGANSDTAGTRIGTATVTKNKGDEAAQSAGFYAIAYDWNGQKVIAYRGTDNPTLRADPIIGASDIVSGWVAAAGEPTSQVGLALDFYQAVSGHSVFDTPLPSNVILTGHSLGGGLAGLIAANDGACLAMERAA
jgi:hypothetical protein